MLKHLPKQRKELPEGLINWLEPIKGVQCFVDSFVKQKLLCYEYIWHVILIMINYGGYKNRTNHTVWSIAHQKLMHILENKLIPAVFSKIRIIRLTNFDSDFSKVQY